MINSYFYLYFNFLRYFIKMVNGTKLTIAINSKPEEISVGASVVLEELFTSSDVDSIEVLVPEDSDEEGGGGGT